MSHPVSPVSPSYEGTSPIWGPILMTSSKPNPPKGPTSKYLHTEG